MIVVLITRVMTHLMCSNSGDKFSKKCRLLCSNTRSCRSQNVVVVFSASLDKNCGVIVITRGAIGSMRCSFALKKPSLLVIWILIFYLRSLVSCGDWANPTLFAIWDIERIVHNCVWVILRNIFVEPKLDKILRVEIFCINGGFRLLANKS